MTPRYAEPNLEPVDDEELYTVLSLLEVLSGLELVDVSAVRRERDPITPELELERVGSVPEWTESELRSAWGDR